MRFFAKSVTNPDVCFCQDVVELVSAISDYTTNTAWVATTRRVLTERGLIGIFDEHAEKLAGYIVKDCYPSDRNELMNHAEALFEIATTTLDWRQNPIFINTLLRLASKMGLYDSEKRKLIVKYLFDGHTTEFTDKMVDRFVHTY